MYLKRYLNEIKK